MSAKQPRFAFAGDRDLAVTILDWLVRQEARPLALLICGEGKASHAGELIGLCPFLKPGKVLAGKRFRETEGLETLRALELDYIIGVHFPYIIPQEILDVPRRGVLNLHPAFLPYNRGWHTPTWSILEGTPIGATLHFMDAGVDTGDVVDQAELEVSPGDTANILYARLKQLEIELFKKAWPRLADGDFQRQPQDAAAGTFHKRSDLFSPEVQRLDLDAMVKSGDLIRRLRALTTSAISEAAYYEVGDRRYRIQVKIQEEPASDSRSGAR